MKKLIMNLPFYEYESIVYEETPLKQELAGQLDLPYNQVAINNAVFFNDRFPIEILKQTRLSFLTSRTLIDNGGRSFLDDKDFSDPISDENEQMTMNFIID